MNRKYSIHLLIYVMIALTSLFILLKPYGSGDELWNYVFAKNIAQGMIPYRDFSIVQTPLSAYIPALLMMIFGQGLFIYRIAGWLLLTGTLSLIFHMCERNTKSLFFSVISVCFCAGLIYPYFIYNYNHLNILLILVILELEICQENHRIRHQVLIGLLVGFFPLIKQNTGAVLLIAHWIIFGLAYAGRIVGRSGSMSLLDI